MKDINAAEKNVTDPIIDVDSINDLIASTPKVTTGDVKNTLTKDTLTLEDINKLLSVEDIEALNLIYKAANRVKETHFGKRVVLFAPLYISNHCINGCLYCGFRKQNSLLPRKALEESETLKEAKFLADKGFKRVLLVLGEDPAFGAEYIADMVNTVQENTPIDTVHVNAPPMDRAELKKISATGAEFYQVFQETYHLPTYRTMHPTGIKKDYNYRIDVMDRVIDAGFTSVGLGALLGLYDYRFDVLATIMHARYIETHYGSEIGIGLSIPRLKPAKGTDFDNPPAPVNDEELKKITAVYRLAVPRANITVSTREEAGLRHILLKTGASQMSAASSTEPGGYTKVTDGTLAQFETTDHRIMEDVMKDLIEEGHLPSITSGPCPKDEADVISNTADAILSLKKFTRSHKLNGNTTIFEGAIKRALGDLKDSPIKKELATKLNSMETRS